MSCCESARVCWTIGRRAQGCDGAGTPLVRVRSFAVQFRLRLSRTCLPASRFLFVKRCKTACADETRTDSMLHPLLRFESALVGQCLPAPLFPSSHGAGTSFSTHSRFDSFKIDLRVSQMKPWQGRIRGGSRFVQVDLKGPQRSDPMPASHIHRHSNLPILPPPPTAYLECY